MSEAELEQVKNTLLLDPEQKELMLAEGPYRFSDLSIYQQLATMREMERRLRIESSPTTAHEVVSSGHGSQDLQQTQQTSEDLKQAKISANVINTALRML